MDSTSLKRAIVGISLLALGGCATVAGKDILPYQDATVTAPKFYKKKAIPKPAGPPISVAVYRFNDQTGQRKASQNVAVLSSAITQGADNYLIRSLQEIGGGKWFKVVERGHLDHLIKERQIIRQMREMYQGKEAKQLPPMLFAGVLLTGGIVGYDSNIKTGGAGARFLGIGVSTQYSIDEIVVSLRAVSVNTSEVLASVTTTKTVYSFKDNAGVLKFIDAGTKALEAELGSASNESMNKAVQLGVHAAVLELIKEGARKKHWKIKGAK
jgi:curli production assembly/transport component CsgG